MPVIVLAMPADNRAGPSQGDTTYSATVAFPADPRHASASPGAQDDRALNSLILTLTSAIQELTETLHADQTPPPAHLGPVTDDPLRVTDDPNWVTDEARWAADDARWATSTHRGERPGRPRRMPAHGRATRQ